MEKKKGRILLVEDDRTLSTLVRDILEINKYEVVLCSNGEEGLATFKSQKFDLMLVDIMMPKMDGITMIKEIRRYDQRVPIVIISAKDMKDDKIEGFRAGADDYVVKPFSTDELLLRIDAILKRVQRAQEMLLTTTTEIIEFGNCKLDVGEQNLTIKNKTMHLTRKECDLIRLLAMKRNELLLREVALKAIWGDDDYFIGRSMDVFISRIRKYLKDDNKVEIVNVHGLGFKMMIK
ncbi:MAG: two-component system response regulator [Bacteroidetes bacterium GWF2_43_63]|nr:MAG: two-component system response regulator [Bacteroidetes bacterium GWE2_42_42]OFY55449.1 MAG: two-component system response regulator [Bacteroidetes bacterium GWF2_43_63]HBG70304.1 DNA-binding response regulator [Bacteroidales bacterium]HCB60311.1 DNA-binding response regulator [Bacteroidales bacterium]HCY23577.1 DNA-binding response regulator [Bacteroidales bacterium]